MRQRREKLVFELISLLRSVACFLFALQQLLAFRFGNAIFQYAALRVLAKRHDLDWQCSPWAGQELFGFADSPPDRKLRLIQEKVTHGIGDTIIPHLREPPCDVEVRGYFQYHTSWHAPDREFLLHLFERPVDSIRQRLETAAASLKLRWRAAASKACSARSGGRAVFGNFAAIVMGGIRAAMDIA